jgi:uncharacterized membrane protein YGL010W
MADTDKWLDDYGKSHRNIRYAPVYWVCVPMLVVGVVGLLWAMPVPGAFFAISPALNWATAFLLAAVVYYFIISMPLAIGMLPFLAALVTFELWLQHSEYSALRAAAGLTLASVVGLYLGRRENSGFKAVLEDVQLLMIAPFWLLSLLYRRLGIPY